MGILYELKMPARTATLATLAAGQQESKEGQQEAARLFLKIQDCTREIKGLTTATKDELASSKNELMKMIGGLDKDIIPTMFVILPAPDEFEELLATAENATTDLKTPTEAATAVTSCFDCANDLYNSVAPTVEGMMEDPHTAIKEKLVKLVGFKTFKMYLLCELCLEKQ